MEPKKRHVREIEPKNSIGRSKNVRVSIDDDGRVICEQLVEKAEWEKLLTGNKALMHTLVRYGHLNRQLKYIKDPSIREKAAGKLGEDLLHAFIDLEDEDDIAGREEASPHEDDDASPEDESLHENDNAGRENEPPREDDDADREESSPRENKGADLEDDFLRESELFIQGQLERRMRMLYMAYSLLAAFVLASIFSIMIIVWELPEAETRRVILYGGLGGCLGAFISILHRNRTLKINPWVSQRTIFTQAVSKVLLGCLFGGVIAILIKSEILLGMEFPIVPETTEEGWLLGEEEKWQRYKAVLLMFGIVAGFSERLVPELLGKIEQGVLATKEVGGGK